MTSRRFYSLPHRLCASVRLPAIIFNDLDSIGHSPQFAVYTYRSFSESRMIGVEKISETLHSRAQFFSLKTFKAVGGIAGDHQARFLLCRGPCHGIGEGEIEQIEMRAVVVLEYRRKSTRDGAKEEDDGDCRPHCSCSIRNGDAEANGKRSAAS